MCSFLTSKQIAPLMVQVVGLEPTRSHLHWILSPTRLPFHHTCVTVQLG